MQPANERGENRGAGLLSRAGSHNRSYRRVQRVLALIVMKRRMVTDDDVTSFFTWTLANQRQP